VPLTGSTEYSVFADSAELSAQLKNARKITDKRNQVWHEDTPPGQPEMSCLETQYADKLALILGLKLPVSCGTETCVLFLINLYETFGSVAAYLWGQAHPEFFQGLDLSIVKNVLHSTKIPSGLSLRTFVNVSRAFWEKKPNEPLRVLIIGAGCGMEEAGILANVPPDKSVEICKVDILGWVGDVMAVHPKEDWLQADAPRCGVVVASISASRSPECEIPWTIRKMVTALEVGGTCCISDDDAAKKWKEAALAHLLVLQGMGAVDAVECVEYKKKSAWQIKFTKPMSATIAADTWDAVEAEYLRALVQDRRHHQAEIQAATAEKAAVSLNIYTEHGEICKVFYPGVYVYETCLRPEDVGAAASLHPERVLRYAGSAQDVVIRVPKSVKERIGKFGLRANADWQMKLHWQLAYLHPDSLAWTWSKAEVRFLYEFAESVVINTNRRQWNLNIANDGFHLGRSRNLLLEGLFSGIFDLETYEARFAWIKQQSWHPKYKAALVEKLSKVLLFASAWGEDVEALQAQLSTPRFDFLSPEQREEYYNKLSTQGLFGGAWGEDVEELQKLLLTPRFAFLSPEQRKKLHQGLANQHLFAGHLGKTIAEVLLEMDTVDFDHLDANRKADFVQTFKDAHFICKCTRIECDEYGAAAVTDRQKALHARAMKKFVGIGRGKGQDVHPHLDALNEAWLLVRAEFPVICLLSSKADVNFHAVDIESAPKEKKTGWGVWRRDLTVPVCNARMDHYLGTDLEEYPRSVLVNFKRLLTEYATHSRRLYTGALAREDAGLPPRLSGGQKGTSKTITPKDVAAVLKVMCLRIQKCCLHSR